MHVMRVKVYKVMHKNTVTIIGRRRRRIDNFLGCSMFLFQLNLYVNFNHIDGGVPLN